MSAHEPRQIAVEFGIVVARVIAADIVGAGEPDFSADAKPGEYTGRGYRPGGIGPEAELAQKQRLVRHYLDNDRVGVLLHVQRRDPVVAPGETVAGDYASPPAAAAQVERQGNASGDAQKGIVADRTLLRERHPFLRRNPLITQDGHVPFVVVRPQFHNRAQGLPHVLRVHGRTESCRVRQADADAPVGGAEFVLEHQRSAQISGGFGLLERKPFHRIILHVHRRPGMDADRLQGLRIWFSFGDGPVIFHRSGRFLGTQQLCRSHLHRSESDRLGQQGVQHPHNPPVCGGGAIVELAGRAESEFVSSETEGCALQHLPGSRIQRVQFIHSAAVRGEPYQGIPRENAVYLGMRGCEERLPPGNPVDAEAVVGDAAGVEIFPYPHWFYRLQPGRGFVFLERRAGFRAQQAHRGAAVIVVLHRGYHRGGGGWRRVMYHPVLQQGGGRIVVFQISQHRPGLQAHRCRGLVLRPDDSAVEFVPGEAGNIAGKGPDAFCPTGSVYPDEFRRAVQPRMQRQQAFVGECEGVIAVVETPGAHQVPPFEEWSAGTVGRCPLCAESILNPLETGI